MRRLIHLWGSYMFRFPSFRQAAFAVIIAATFGSASAEGASGKKLIGQPAPLTSSARVVDVNTSKFANIAYGETVIFRGNGDSQFAWTFDGLGGRSWDLAKFAPPGFSDKEYRVYVKRNPLYRRN